jgi:IS5 family transposase
MSNAALDQDLATMTTAIESLKIQRCILLDQQARMKQLRAMIFSGDKAHARLTAKGTVGRKGILDMLATNVAAYRLELAALDALFAGNATA